MNVELDFWTGAAADKAIDNLVSGKAYGVIYSEVWDPEGDTDTINLYAENMSHAKRMAKRLGAYTDTEVVVRPYKDGAFSVSFSTAPEVESSFRRDFLWSEDETAHALTLFHMLISLDDIADYLHRTPVAILSRISNFIGIPVLRPSDDNQLDLFIDELLEAIFLCDAGFTPVRSNPPGDNWLDTSYSKYPHMVPILRVAEKHRLEIKTEALVTDIIGALQGVKCRDPDFVFDSVMDIINVYIERPKITAETFYSNRTDLKDTHFEELYPIYVMARDLINLVDLWFDPPYRDNDGLNVTREVLWQVINELAIDEVLGIYDGVKKLTSNQKERAFLSDMVSHKKQNDPLIQTAYAVSARDGFALWELANQGNWHAALIGASLADWDGDWSTSARNDFVDMCRHPARPIYEDSTPFSSLRQYKSHSIIARRILNELQK